MVDINGISNKQLNQKYNCWRIIQLKIDWRYYTVYQFVHIRNFVHIVFIEF